MEHQARRSNLTKFYNNEFYTAIMDEDTERIEDLSKKHGSNCFIREQDAAPGGLWKVKQILYLLYKNVDRTMSTTVRTAHTPGMKFKGYLLKKERTPLFLNAAYLCFPCFQFVLSCHVFASGLCCPPPSSGCFYQKSKEHSESPVSWSRP